MTYSENEGVLCRGSAGGLPQEVWGSFEGRFVPYAFANQVMPDWGHVIDEKQAQAIMDTARSKSPAQMNARAFTTETPCASNRVP